jgi:hypothetical protein
MNPLGPPFMLAAVATFVFACGTALADTPDLAGADALFRRGRASAEAGDYPAACAAFAESLRLEPATGTLFNLADCEEHLGRIASARGHYLRVESTLPSTDERHDIAREHARALSLRVPWLVIAPAPGAPLGVRVFRDDVELDATRLGVPLPVDPGSHGVLVVAVGHESRSTAWVLREGETLRVVASPGPALGPPVPHAALRPAPTHVAAWLVGATGVVSLGVGTYFGARALAERSASDASCAHGVCASASGLDAYESARRDALASDVAVGIGIVALAIGGYLLLGTGREPRASTALQLTGSGVSCPW